MLKKCNKIDPCVSYKCMGNIARTTKTLKQ